MVGSSATPIARQPRVKQRLWRSIAARSGEVVLRRDLVRFGSQAQISRALKQLMGEGKLVRIGSGVYAKAAPGPLSGLPMARQPLGALAAETFNRLGIAWKQGAAQRRYNSGATTQVPWRTTFNTGQQRISRRLQIGKRVVEYENDLTRPAWRRRRSRSARPV
ncbi:MAG: hypothetical protein TQ37_02050 [Candidatus Synechococcus spongiarum 15L]|uniref:S-adenosylhomocysteine hydrolase n=2 Tax=Candidatus Synechococcus spongiarum TaxID=431041 RepID=A0A1T1C909_9SYNE|nr:MAG: hypothetical protein TQ37_02050 [Candidatus Synechococcus spongiarum 15L]OOV25115.1 hypothetical protein BV61_07200 [Candidatus Synechococcus spongiarum LMB bulk15M]